MASAGGRAIQEALCHKLQLVVKIERTRLDGEMRPRDVATVSRAGDSHSPDDGDDDDDVEVKKITKKKISARALQYSDEEDDDDDCEATKNKKKKISETGHHSDEGGDDDDSEAKKIKEKKTSSNGLHHSHEKSHKPEAKWRIKLKKQRAVPKQHAAIPLKQVTFANGETPGEVRCIYCSRTFKTVAGMKVHRTRIHIQKEGNVPWCATCREVFQDVKKLNQHSKRCAGMRKNGPGTTEPLMLQRTPAGFLVPSPGHVRHATPRDKQPEQEAVQKLDQGGLLRPPAVVPKYQFQLPTPTKISPDMEAAAKNEKHIAFGTEEGVPKVEGPLDSPTRSPRRKSLRPRKILKVAGGPSRENSEWGGAHHAFQQDGERRVQPSRSAKSAVESYCECSNKSGLEDSQDGETRKTQREGCSVPDATGDGDDAQYGSPAPDGNCISADSGVQTSVLPSSAKKQLYQYEQEERGETAINTHLKKKESTKRWQTLLNHSNRPSVSTIADVNDKSISGGQMKSCMRHASLNVKNANEPNQSDRHLVQRNCLPVTEMVRMSMIPSGSQGKPATYTSGANHQEAATLHCETLYTAGAVGLCKYFHHSAKLQPLHRHTSCQNTDSDDSEGEGGSSSENLYIDSGERQSPVNTSCQMHSLESEDQNNLATNTNYSYSCQKPSPPRVGKDDAGTLLKRNTDNAPLNLSTDTSADVPGNNEPSNLNDMVTASPVEENNGEFSDKSATSPQQGNSPQSSDTQVDGRLQSTSCDTGHSGKDDEVMSKASTQDTALDLRKGMGESHAVPHGTGEVLNFEMATTSSNGVTSDLENGPNIPSLKIKAGKICDSTNVEADEQPTCEDKTETEAANNMAESPSQFSESEDLTALDSVLTVAASADDEASDGSETETCDDPTEVWSPDRRSEYGDRSSERLNSNGLVSSTTSITAVFNESSTRSEVCENRYHSPETCNTAEQGACRRLSSSSEKSITSNTLRESHNGNNETVPSPAESVTNGRLHSDRAEQGAHLQTADSTTEDPMLEGSNVSQAFSVTQSQRDETFQSQPLGRNIVDKNGSDEEICEVKAEKSNVTLKEENPSKLQESIGKDATLPAGCKPSGSKEKRETDKEKEPEEATLPSIEIMKKMLETIPKPPKSPAQEQATQTDQQMWNSRGGDKTAEATTQGQELVGFFLAPATLTIPHAPTPRTITVAKDLSEYESSSCSSFAEHLMKTQEIDSSPAAVETEEGLSRRNSRTDLRGEELSRSSLTDGGSTLNRGNPQSSLPVTVSGSAGSNPPKGTVENEKGCAAPAQGVALGSDTRLKIGTDAGNMKPGVGVLTTGDSWLVAMTPFHYGTTTAPVSPLPVYVNCSVVSPLSPLVAFECIRSPQSERGTKVKAVSQTDEERSAPRPQDEDRESQQVSEEKLPPFSTLAKSLVETERPDRPCSLPAGVKMELTKIKQTSNETSKSHSVSIEHYSNSVNASSSTGAETAQKDIDSKPSSTLAECSSHKDEEPYILYEHRPKATNSSLQGRPSSVPTIKSEQKEQPNIVSFHEKNQLEQKSNAESNQKGTVMVTAAADQYAYKKETTPQGLLSNRTPEGPAGDLHSYSQQPHTASNGGSPLNIPVANPSYTAPQDTPWKGAASAQGVPSGPWPVFETGQVSQQNNTGNDQPFQEVTLQGTLHNASSNNKNTTYTNVPQPAATDIMTIARSEVGKMSHSMQEAPCQNTITPGGQSTLPNLPDIIDCDIGDSTPKNPTDTGGNKQTERCYGGIPTDGQMVRESGSGGRGRGGRRGPSNRDDLHPCECPCGKICKNYRGLEQHKARAHRDVVFFKGEGSESCCSWPHVLGARSFQCPCGARFGRLDAIRKHFAAEQAESGGRRWWISDRVPICVCRHASHRSGGYNYKVPSSACSYLQSYHRANQTPQPTFSHVLPLESCPEATLQHQHTPGESKQSWSSPFEMHSNPVTYVRGLQNTPTQGFGGIPGQCNSNLPGLWSPPFPVSRPSSQSAARAMKPTQATAQHHIHQNSASGWWSPTIDAQSSVVQQPSKTQTLASMQDCSSVTRFPVERYTLGRDSGSDFQRTMPALLARPHEMTAMADGRNANGLQQFTTGGLNGWSYKYGSQSTDGSWTPPVAPSDRTSPFIPQQQLNKFGSNRRQEHTGRATPQLKFPDMTISQNSVAVMRNRQQQGNPDRPASRSLVNVAGISRPEPQRWNFQHPTSTPFVPTAQLQPKQKSSFSPQEFSSPHQHAAPFHWGLGMLPPQAAHGQSITAATGEHPWQSLTQQTVTQSDYSGSGMGFDITPQPSRNPTRGMQGCSETGLRMGPAFRAKGEEPVGTAEDGRGCTTSLNAALVATMKDDPLWKPLPNSNNRES